MNNEHPGPNTFFCIDGHTAGNPVRLVVGGAPRLRGATMSDRRTDFIERYDWVRRALTFEPRGHDLMSGAILYQPTREDCDIGVLFIETTGCLPMCGHVSLGVTTMVIEKGLVQPLTPGVVRLDTPAGVVEVSYRMEGRKVVSARMRNVPAYVAATGLQIEVEGLGRIKADVAYGGNFYAIIEPQENYRDCADLTTGQIIAFSPVVIEKINALHDFVHPLDPAVRKVDHVIWSGGPLDPASDARNACFYGQRAIDRSPCGTGTSARLAQLVARGEMGVGSTFVHESVIGTVFSGRVEELTDVVGIPAVITTIEGSAHITGFNTIVLDETDPFRAGFLLA